MPNRTLTIARSQKVQSTQQTTPQSKGRFLHMPEGDRPPTRKQVDALLKLRPDIGTVYVTSNLARLFRAPPNDGRAWYIEDPESAYVLHFTSPQRKYVRWLEPGNASNDSSSNNSFALPILVKHKDRPSQKRRKRRLAEVSDLDFEALLRNPELIQNLPAILIPLVTVERMTGFKKSFVYAQPDFPQPIKFGTSKRSAVRWNLREVLAWIELHMTQRGATACMEPDANVGTSTARQMHQLITQSSPPQFAVTATRTQHC